MKKDLPPLLEKMITNNYYAINLTLTDQKGTGNSDGKKQRRIRRNTGITQRGKALTQGGGGKLVEHLAQHIGHSGSVIVWNKTFEMGRNREMAVRYPEYGDLLKEVNERVFDLMECFSKGYYIHPDFHGSASIKSVLPVLVDDPDLDYAGIPISSGNEAMLAWPRIVAEVCK